MLQFSGFHTDTQTQAWGSALVWYMALVLSACNETQVPNPSSLNSPRAMAIARGEVCLRSVAIDDRGIVEPELIPCTKRVELELDRIDALVADGELSQDESERARAKARLDYARGAIGFVVNDQIDKVSVLDASLRTPHILDLDISTPGISHIQVGKRPVSVDVSTDGTVAYVANQGDRTLSLIDVWVLRPLSASIALSGTPIKVAVRRDNGDVVVATANPSALVTRPGVRCEAPTPALASPGARRTYEPDKDCSEVDAQASALALDGHISDMILDPNGGVAYVSYRDRAYLSVVALELDDANDACLVGTQAPCEIARVGLTTECSDGIDNDGDGSIDQADAQCYGPWHAESEGGTSRRVASVCADGLDNDNDGLTDRDDPECLASQWGDESMAAPGFDPVRACGDGADNDGDKVQDYPQDPSCYGLQGHTEVDARPRGYGALGVDEVGAFVYVLDPTEHQVLVVDARRRILIDAAQATEPSDPFAKTLGVSLGNTPVPTALMGRVTRSMSLDPREEYRQRHGIARYEYGAYVAADNGFVYYVDTATVFCEVFERAPTLMGESVMLTHDAFYHDPAARAASVESHCLTIPALPLRSSAQVSSYTSVESCAQVFLCQQCIEGGLLPDECTSCQNMDANTHDARLATCRMDWRHRALGLVRQTVNPTFQVRDSADQSSGFLGRATCTQPEEMKNALSAYLEEHPRTRASLGCGSVLMPQPLSISVPTSGRERPDDFLTSDRVDMLEKRDLELVFDADDEGEVHGVKERVTVGVQDVRARDEAFRVTYEGVLPALSRKDGLVDEDDGRVFHIGNIDVCRAGVEPGDRIILEALKEDLAPRGCDAFLAGDEGGADFLTYEIVRARTGVLELAVLPATDQGPSFVTELPRRSCFKQGWSYEVRPVDVWVVSGEDTGIESGRVRVDDECVPVQGLNTGRVGFRVRTGEVFQGPFFSFYLYPGQVEAVRDLEFRWTFVRNFASASTESLDRIDTEVPHVSQLHLDALLPGGSIFFALDPSTNSIYVRNFSTQDGTHLF